MSLSDELRDPWGLLTAAVSGGLAWAVLAPQINDGAAAIVGGGIALVALGIKVAAGAVVNRNVVGEHELEILQGSPEEAWLRRAEHAADSLQDVASAARPGPIAQRLADVVAEAGSTLADMRRLAGQTSAITSAMWRVDVTRLRREEEQLLRASKTAIAAHLRQEVDRSLVSVRGQLDVHTRLYDAGAALLARMQSGALGLESLVARVAELVALADASPSAVNGLQQIDELAADLEGLRLGLAETEELSRRVLGAEAPADDLAVFRQDDTTTRDRRRAGPLQGGN